MRYRGDLLPAVPFGDNTGDTDRQDRSECGDVASFSLAAAAGVDSVDNAGGSMAKGGGAIQCFPGGDFGVDGTFAALVVNLKSAPPWLYVVL